MVVLVQDMLLCILPFHNSVASSHLVRALYQFLGTAGREVEGHGAPRDLFPTPSRAWEWEGATCGEMGRDDVVIRPCMSAVRTGILSTATRFLQV